MRKGSSIHQEDIISINTYDLNTIEPKDLNGEMKIIQQ